jgi:hypothetical protein
MENRNRKEIDKMIRELTDKGHSNHCASRQVFGKSKCVCGIDELIKEKRK